MPLVTQEQRWRIHVTSFYDYISDQHRDWFILTSAVALTGRAGGDGISPAAGPRHGEAPDLLGGVYRGRICTGPCLHRPTRTGDDILVLLTVLKRFGNTGLLKTRGEAQ